VKSNPPRQHCWWRCLVPGWMLAPPWSSALPTDFCSHHANRTPSLSIVNWEPGPSPPYRWGFLAQAVFPRAQGCCGSARQGGCWRWPWLGSCGAPGMQLPALSPMLRLLPVFPCCWFSHQVLLCTRQRLCQRHCKDSKRCQTVVLLQAAPATCSQTWSHLAFWVRGSNPVSLLARPSSLPGEFKTVFSM